MANIETRTGTIAPTDNMVTLTHVLYALHGFSALMGVLGPMFILTAFLTGWPSIIAVIINYVKRGDTRGTFLDSHFGWQLRTFWYALLWLLLVLGLMLTIVGIPVAILVAVIVGLWVLYRIIRGWMSLASGQPMPV
ncbi:MAG: hypothetical protein FJY54_10640 [Betaproteobacteria bacterium]|nr:hypothetical protein [Betaproteobacteria bacterium]